MSASELGATFVMRATREAMALGLAHVERQVQALEAAVFENPDLAFDLAKTLVESAVRTVLRDRQVAFGPDEDLPSLFRNATRVLPFLPQEASEEAAVRDSLRKTLSGLQTAVQGICELRNACGLASHGRDRPRPAMGPAQALLAAEAADAIVGFLHRVHRLDRVPDALRDMRYEDHQGFNELVDELHGPIRIYEALFRASEVLFRMEPESYRVYLVDSAQEPAEEAQ